ncbi:MAG: ATP-binding protein [Acidobacteriota bacterium]
MSLAFWRSWSLRTKVLVLTGCISASVLGLMAWLAAVRTAYQIEKLMSDRAVQTLQRLSSHLETVPPGEIPRGLELQAQELLELEPSVVRIDVFGPGPDGLTLLASSAERQPREATPAEENALKEGKILSFVTEQDGRRLLFTVHPFRFGNGQPGFMTVINSLDIVDAIIQTHSRLGIYLMGSSILLLVGGTAWLFRTTVARPVLELMEVMNRFKSGDSSARADQELPAEFSALAKDLNIMLDEIQQLNENMKRRIEEATMELEARNRELESINLQLFEAQKLRNQAERLALAGRLTASLAHDIGSPLGAVSTHLQLLMEDKRLPSDLERRVRLANEQIDRVCGIVESLLSTTRVRPQKRPVDLMETIEAVLQLLGPGLARSEIQAEVIASIEGPCAVLGDPGQLQQVFLNLLNNAMDAISGSGKITVRLRPVDEAGDPEWRIEVEDDGEGIPPENLASIFEPFFSAKQKAQGTGIGLAVSQEIINQHGGRIQVDSKPGEGTRFTVFLPRLVPSVAGERTGNS